MELFDKAEYENNTNTRILYKVILFFGGVMFIFYKDIIRGLLKISAEFGFNSSILLNYPLNDFINKIKLKQKPNLNIDILNNNKVNTFRKKIIKQINFGYIFSRRKILFW